MTSPIRLNDIDTIKLLDVETLRKKLTENAELAVFDTRETGLHAREGHIFLSTTLPLSRIELDAPQLLPRKSVEIVLYDDGEGDLAERAAYRLGELGYSNVSILAGGTRAWVEAGGELFTGVHMVGIAFGEFAEVHYGTPHVSARELKRRIDAGENIRVIDSRPEDEFRNFSIPGAVDLPGAELVYRFHETVPDPDTTVVINCAGRTRSIIGAQALINAGVPNKVVSLAGGTMDWLFEGYTLDHGKSNLGPEPQGKARDLALASGERLRRRFGIEEISLAQLGAFRAEQANEKRSVYVFDIRTEQEYLDGHLPGSVWVAGGQLVQQIDRWVGTRNARIVLIDAAEGVRAAITASWLKQINWGEVYVLQGGAEGEVETGRPAPRLAIRPELVQSLDAAGLKQRLAGEDLTLLDFSTSTQYRAGHIPTARFAIRSRIGALLPGLPETGAVVVTSDDGRLAGFAAAELKAQLGARVWRLEGGNAAWIAAGNALETGAPGDLPFPADDVSLNPYQHPEAERHAAFRRYLQWEIDLVAQLERDGTAGFRSFPPLAD